MGINDIIKIGDRIKSFRKNLNLNQEEMANKLSIPRSTYANYESNKREPNADIIYKICEVFNISVHELIGDYATENPTNSFNTDLFLNDIGKYLFKPSDFKENLDYFPPKEQEALYGSFISLIASKAWQSELGFTSNDIQGNITELFNFTLEMLDLKIKEIKYKNLIKTK